MNEEYFDTMEDYCYDSLSYLNEDQSIFELLARMPKKHPIDASGETKGGCECLMELKARSGNTYFSDYFIETKKVAYLLLSYVVYGYIPLYVNFVDCEVGNTPKKVLVWRLDRLQAFGYNPSMKTWSSGYGKYEYREKITLSVDDATIYELQENGEYKMVQNRNAKRGC